MVKRLTSPIYRLNNKSVFQAHNYISRNEIN